MRIWTLHPKYLDQKSLGAAWREGLMAQSALSKYLKGKKVGYANHSQLIRFKSQDNPLQLLCNYLHYLWEDSVERGYSFNRRLIQLEKTNHKLKENQGQLEYEWHLLLSKLKIRSPYQYTCRIDERTFEDLRPSPVFTIIPGGIQDWEKGKKI
jgi:hypothetical protein